MKLKIGPFNDEIMCDIIPMDYFHILLGRSWKFHRHVVYDGITNKYNAWKDGVTYTLLSLIETLDEMNCIAVRICMVNGKKFEKEMRKNLIFFP